MDRVCILLARNIITFVIIARQSRFDFPDDNEIDIKENRLERNTK